MKKTTTTITDAGKLPTADAEKVRRIWIDMAGKQVDIITVESLAVDIVPLDKLIKEMVMLQGIAEISIDENEAGQILDRDRIQGVRARPIGPHRVPRSRGAV